MSDPNDLPPELLAPELLAQYMAGTLDPVTRRPVQAVLEATERQRTYLAGIRAAVRAEDIAAMPAIEDARREFFARLAALEPIATDGAVRSQIAMDAGERVPPQKGRKRYPKVWAFSKHRRMMPPVAAAMIGMAVMVGIFAIQRYGVVSPSTTGGEQRYETQTGQSAVLTLADGSRVTLAPQTTLTITPGFGATSRTVALTGEGFFEVSQATGAPFVVRTGSTETRVLGTEFVVRRYASDGEGMIAVVGGKVAVTQIKSQPSLTLIGGNVADFTDSTTTLRSSEGATQQATWVNGRLVFHHAPAREVLTTLSRWYGYDFRLADSTLADVKLTAWVSTESSSAALGTLKRVLDVTMTFEGTTVTLHPRRAAAPMPKTFRDSREDNLTLRHEVGR